MKVDILKTVVGASWRFFEGQRLDIPDEALVKTLCDNGFARPIGPESAAFQPSENAAKFNPNKKRR